MARQAPPDDVKAAARRRRRAADTARWRSRRRRHTRLFKVEVGDREMALAIRFAGLKADQDENTDAVSTAISRLLGKGLAALLNEEAARLK